MSVAQLELSLITWFKAHAPAAERVIWGDQNAPKPGPLEITLRRGNPYIRKPGRDVPGSVNPATGTRPLLGTRELLIEARAFGVDAIQTLEDLRARLDDDSTSDTLQAGALAVFDTGEVMNLTSLYSSQFKEVASFEIHLRTHSLREGADAETGVGYIQSVDLEVTTKDPAGAATVRNIHVTSPPG